MHVYTARQAIMNRKQHVIAYELLFRDSEENIFPKVDPHAATSQMIIQTHLNSGLGAVTCDKPAFINFTEKCLLSGFPELLPKNKVVIEILETVRPTDEVFEKCRALFHAGYTLALDDFIYKREWKRFFRFVKIIKFDISQTPLNTLSPVLAVLKENYKNIRYLAERIETQAQFVEARKMGFHFFQGYFFCKPEIHKARHIDTEHELLFELYQELCKTELDINRITDCFQRDLGLTYKLLRYINSGVLPLKTNINSIKEALVYLGEEQTRKFLTLLTTATLAKNKPKEIIRMAIVRARSCELTAKKVLPGASGEAFLMGLLSLIDAILDRPMESILDELPISDEIKDALLNERSSGLLRVIINAVRHFEKGKWHDTSKECLKLRVSYESLAGYFNDAMTWAKLYEDSINAPVGVG